MEQINVYDAKSQLSRLLAAVERGEEIVIARAGRPIAKLVPFDPPPQRQRVLGRDRGLFEVPAAFDEPLPAEIAEAFGA